MRRMYDAAYPPAHPPAWEAVAGYLGGDTPHAWRADEWATQPARYRLPIWTRSNPGTAAQGGAEGVTAAALARGLGMPRTGCAIALDYETAIDDSYLTAFDTAVRAAGYRTVLYGSLSTVMANRTPSAGLWVAHYTGVPHLEPGSVATQYASASMLGTDYDASLVADSLVLWDTAPAPVIPPTPQEDTMPAPGFGSVAPGFAFDEHGTPLDQTKATVITTPPANGGVLKWGAEWLSLGCDFGSARLRVAIHDGTGWTVTTHDIKATDPRLAIALPTNVGKISIARCRTSATDTADATPVGWLIEAGAQ
jgi:hypothetical protein